MNAASRLSGITRAALGVAVVVSIASCDGPRFPVPCGSTPEQTPVVGEMVTVDLCFDDPDGDMLAFEVFSSDPGVATAIAAGSTVTVTAISPGLALVTMVATDPTGLKAQQGFRVVVPNRPPAAVGTIADRELMVGDSAVIDVAGHFTEPDGQALGFSAAVSDSARLAGAVAGAVVTVVAVAKGEAVVTVTATDPGGLAATQSFRVKVPNRPPVPVDSIPAREIMVGSADTLDLSPFFSDPDADPLIYLTAVSDTAVAAATVSGSALTVTGLARGEAGVTITATDDEGLSATQRFGVTVPNRPPMVTDTIPPRTLFRGEADTLDLAAWFADPDGDPLTWAAETSDTAVAGLTLVPADGTLIVTARTQGEATVTATATDTEGLTARQTFAVTVPNRAPVAADTIPPQTLHKRETARLDLTHHFLDPDDDTLVYGIESTDALVATASVTNDTLLVRAGAEGRAVLTVTAADPQGLSVRQAFTVTVLNRAPAITDSIPPQTIFRGPPHTLDLGAHFGDPDGDTLAYEAASSNPRFVRVEVNGSTLTLRAPRKGTAEVTVTATDPDSLSVAQTFAVTVGNRAPVTVGAFPDLELGQGDRITLPVGRYFDDPDRDPLTYGAATSDPGIATATTRGGLVTVSGVSNGLATLTLTATDPDSLSAAQTSRIIVVGQGNTPTPVGTIPAQTVSEGSTQTLQLLGYFEDPNGDPLTYGATTEDPAIATASVTRGIVTITGVALGQTILSVTATDPDGNTGTLGGTVVTVVTPGQGPVPVLPIADRSVAVGQARTISVAHHFQDPDGGSLTFAASSSNPDIATASSSGSEITLTGVAEGRAAVTVTATDPDNLSVAQQFSVTVEPPDRAPVTVGAIGRLTIQAGGVDVFDAAPYFSDPEGDTLTYTAGTSDPGIATASATGSIVIVRGVSAGSTTVSVTATDPGGLSATQSADIEVSAPPRGPETVGRIPYDSLEAGDELDVDVAPYFTHPDGLALSYTAGTSNSSLAAVAMSGSNLRVKGQGQGMAQITVIASDPVGRTATQHFVLTIWRIDTGFEIQLGFASSVSGTLESAMRTAGATWEAILKATEFPDLDQEQFRTLSTFVCPIYGVNFVVDVDYVDDLALLVAETSIDGTSGTVVAATRLCLIRSPSGTPVLGVIVFDNADIDAVARTGDLGELALHEIAHVLGVGTTSSWYALLEDPSENVDTADTHFPGSGAVSAFNSAGGTSYTGGKVPVENGGDDGHWRQSVMDGEFMTPFNTRGQSDVLSAITIQALADMGYTVNAGLAEAYTLPSPDIAADIVPAGPAIDLRGDVYHGPVIEIDEKGNVVRVVPGLDNRFPPTLLGPGEAAARADSVIRITIDGRR